VLDRGVPTNLPCVLPRETLADTIVFLGMAGTSRTRVIERLLMGAQTMGWPWVHITAGGRREAASQRKLWPQLLLIDGHAPDSEQATLACHPLVPPPGCTLPRFQDALLHVLGSVFDLPQSASILLRPALRETYRLAGWTDGHMGNLLTPADLAEQIEVQMRNQALPQEISTLLMTHCILPLRDLADTAAWLFQRETRGWMPTGALLVEVGWVGNELSNRLVRGCLWAWFALALSALEEEATLPRALLSLDEAHLFFPQAASTHDFSLTSLLDQHTAQGCGALLFSDRSNLLAREIHERSALTLLTQQDRAGTLEYIPALTQRQRQRLVHLQPEEIALIARNSEVFLALLT
ncbi:MAG: hypothetical protein ACRDHW_02185, partial [Ktedonobacteraceae bacterium]